MRIYPNRWYVYQHKIGGTIFYIGIGKNGRFLSSSSRNVIWQGIVKENGSYDARIIKWFSNEKSAYAFESAKIHKLRPRANLSHQTIKKWRK